MTARCPRCDDPRCTVPAATAATDGIPGFGEVCSEDDNAKWAALDAALGICDYTPSPLGPPVYLCPGCRRFFPWCHGAASEDNPELCDDCWADARDVDGATAP